MKKTISGYILGFVSGVVIIYASSKAYLYGISEGKRMLKEETKNEKISYSAYRRRIQKES